MTRDSSFDNAAVRELRVLEAVEVDPSVSQRELAREMGVAVGVVNACVRTLARKGMIKIRGESNRSITYHVTREGALRKAALAMQWTANTLEFYRSARRGIAEHVRTLAAAGHRSVVLYGANELAEIAALVLSGTAMDVAGAMAGADTAVGDSIVGIPVVPNGETPVGASQVDLVLLCEIVSSDVLTDLHARFPEAELFSMLGQPLGDDNA